MICVIFVFCAATPIASPAQTLTTLYNFCSKPGCADGGKPFYGDLIQASDGNFYGTTYLGGTKNGGTVFRVTQSGALTTLYNFCSQTNCADGTAPTAGLVQATDGNFYGTTFSGGKFADGTVFKMTSSGTLTTLYSFCSEASCTDGYSPYAGLVQANDGNFYGTTSQGGAHGFGTVFQITAAGTLTTLHSFSGLTDGYSPYAGLILASDGNFYGTTVAGGPHGEGTVFKISSQSPYTLTTLYNFCSQTNCTDGTAPFAALVQASDGNFYGTTAGGGANRDGTAFKITSTGTLTTLYSFCSQTNCTDGQTPEAGLVQATDGNLYGTTGSGGDNASGTVFKLTLAGALTRLYSFCSQANCVDGASPYAGLVQASDGNLYGTTYLGGTGGEGTVFSLDAGLGVTLSVTTVGSGTVASSDGFINCPGTCSHSYPGNTQVTLNATPGQGWLFGAWSGCDRTNNSVCTVTMNSARNVTATFVPAELLSVIVAGSGTVVSGAIDCGSVCSQIYKQGTQVKLTAVPGAGSTLSSWTGCDTMQGDFCTVTMSGARNVTATFMSVQVSLTSLVLNPDSVKGGQTSIATLTLGAAAPPGGLGVGISSDNPRVAHPPSLVVVPGGAISTQFAVRTSPVRQKTVVKITASDNTSQTSAMLTVDPR